MSAETYSPAPLGAVPMGDYPMPYSVSGSGEQHSGQVRMAYRLARSHTDRLLHVHGLGWHYWDGARWAEDTRGYATRAVLDVLTSALAESIGDKQLRADVSRCETASGIAGVLCIAASLVEFAVTVEDLSLIHI